MKIESMQDLFQTTLAYTYDCEQQLVKKGLPSMIKASHSPELKAAFEQHLEETRNHITRLDKVFSALGVKAEGEGNDIVKEMTKVTEKVVKSSDASPIRDAGLIGCGNEVEHYEMAVYGSLVAFARQLGLQNAVRLLEETLQEEKAADAKLTQIAESTVNREAASVRPAA